MCTALCAQSCPHVISYLHTSNSCRWKPPNNDYRGDQLKAANVRDRLRERGIERESRTRSETGPMSNVTGGAAQLKTALSQMMHKPTVVALLMLFWNKHLMFYMRLTDKLRGKAGFSSRLWCACGKMLSERGIALETQLQLYWTLHVILSCHFSPLIKPLSPPLYLSISLCLCVKHVCSQNAVGRLY